MENSGNASSKKAAAAEARGGFIKIVLKTPVEVPSTEVVRSKDSTKGAAREPAGASKDAAYKEDWDERRNSEKYRGHGTKEGDRDQFRDGGRRGDDRDYDYAGWEQRSKHYEYEDARDSWKDSRGQKGGARDNGGEGPRPPKKSNPAEEWSNPPSKGASSSVAKISKWNDEEDEKELDRQRDEWNQGSKGGREVIPKSAESKYGKDDYWDDRKEKGNWKDYDREVDRSHGRTHDREYEQRVPATDSKKLKNSQGYSWDDGADDGYKTSNKDYPRESWGGEKKYKVAPAEEGKDQDKRRGGDFQKDAGGSWKGRHEAHQDVDGYNAKGWEREREWDRGKEVDREKYRPEEKGGERGREWDQGKEWHQHDDWSRSKDWDHHKDWDREKDWDRYKDWDRSKAYDGRGHSGADGYEDWDRGKNGDWGREKERTGGYPAGRGYAAGRDNRHSTSPSWHESDRGGEYYKGAASHKYSDSQRGGGESGKNSGEAYKDDYYSTQPQREFAGENRSRDFPRDDGHKMPPARNRSRERWPDDQRMAPVRERSRSRGERSWGGARQEPGSHERSGGGYRDAGRDNKWPHHQPDVHAMPDHGRGPSSDEVKNSTNANKAAPTAKPTDTVATPATAAKPAASGIVNAALISQIQAQLRAANSPQAQLARKAARRLYVGNLPIGTPGITDTLTDFLNQAMASAGLTMSHIGGVPTSGNPVTSVWLSTQQTFGFAEFRSEEETTSGMALNNIMFQGRNLRISRPADYTNAIQQGLNPISGMNPQLATAASLLNTPGVAAALAHQAAMAAAAAAAAGATRTVAEQPAQTPTTVLCLQNMITLSELEDEATVTEIEEDTREECDKFGKVLTVFIPRLQAPSEAKREADDYVGRIFVAFEKTEAAIAAREKLHNRKFDGRIVIARYSTAEELERIDYTGSFKAATAAAAAAPASDE